ncbi:putative oxidoreductase YjmC [Babylonia areolata]|uniref:putative oxidoreductase YjmC n=1 Tax=Babylonia areolata TaxID=304850 RepID=UPI003FD234A2
MAETGSATPAEERVLIAREDLHAFLVRAFQTAGAIQSHARALADVVVAADYRGHFSHGLRRLNYYMQDLLKANVSTSATQEPEVVKETAATALVDGHNLLGPVVGNFAMDLAIRKAKDVGIGWVSVRGTNHFGIAGWYSMRAQKEGLVGMAFTNTSPMLVPTRSRQQTLGTNPLSLAAPANKGDSMVLDMATTVVAFGKVHVRKSQNQTLPMGWGVDGTGKPSTDPDKVMAVDGGLMPLGGPEETSGYKGYGLALLVEVLCGILSGANYGPHIRHWQRHKGAADLGQCFVAIDPEAFAPGFTDRMSDLLDHCRGLEPAEGEREVLVPGDPERQHMAMCDSRGGIPYQPQQILSADDIAKKYGVEPLKRLSPV